MANVYVHHAAAGAGTGADWANAYTTLAAAFTGGAAGDTFYVAHDHAETQASAMTITTKGTQTAPSRVICVSRTGSVPPVSADLATTATITTTGANGMTIAGGTSVYFYGISFNAGTGATNVGISFFTGNDSVFYAKNCKFRKLGTTGNAGAIQIGGNMRTLGWLENCDVELGAATDALSFGGTVVWRGGNYTAGAVPTTGFLALGTIASDVLIEGVDLSAITPGTSTLVRAYTNKSRMFFKDCKLGASVVIAATPTIYGADVNVVRSDSGDTNYRTESHQYTGVLTTETTTVRTGGASDGATTYSWEIVPNANNERDFPFNCPPIMVWNDTVGSAITLTIEGTWAGGAVPTTNDIWMIVEYLGTSGFPLGVVSNGNVDPLATGTNHSSSTETWGAGGTTKFKMTTSFTPQEKGPICVYIKYAHTSNTVWIDPKITIS